MIIGNGCVIGAGCVVNRDMEPYSIVVGVPGKQIKKRFDEETIKLLEELKWWNWSDEEIVSNIDFLRDIPTPQKIRKLFEKT